MNKNIIIVVLCLLLVVVLSSCTQERIEQGITFLVGENDSELSTNDAGPTLTVQDAGESLVFTFSSEREICVDENNYMSLGTMRTKMSRLSDTTGEWEFLSTTRSSCIALCSVPPPKALRTCGRPFVSYILFSGTTTIEWNKQFIHTRNNYRGHKACHERLFVPPGEYKFELWYYESECEKRSDRVGDYGIQSSDVRVLEKTFTLA